jgi:hypothetical protein
MHAELNEGTENKSSSGTTQYINTCFMGEKKSLEIVSSNIAGAHGCLQTSDQDGNVMGQVPGRRESQVEVPGKSLDSNILYQHSDTPKVMGSFYEGGLEISRKWLKVNVCYPLGLGVEFSVRHCDEEGAIPCVTALCSP